MSQLSTINYCVSILFALVKLNAQTKGYLQAIIIVDKNLLSHIERDGCIGKLYLVLVLVLQAMYMYLNTM